MKICWLPCCALLQGAICVLIGVSTAGLVAFTLARTFGKPLAKRIVSRELGEGSESSLQPLQASVARVQSAIEQGDFWQQCTAVTLLRLTLVPFRSDCFPPCACLPVKQCHKLMQLLQIRASLSFNFTISGQLARMAMQNCTHENISSHALLQA